MRLMTPPRTGSGNCAMSSSALDSSTTALLILHLVQRDPATFPPVDPTKCVNGLVELDHDLRAVVPVEKFPQAFHVAAAVAAGPGQIPHARGEVEPIEEQRHEHPRRRLVPGGRL